MILGAYRDTPVRSLETSAQIPPLDLYLTAQKAAFEKRLKDLGIAAYIRQAATSVKTSLLQRRRLRAPSASGASGAPGTSEDLIEPRKALQAAWKKRWLRAYEKASEGGRTNQPADYPIWTKRGALPLYKNLKKADASILTQLRTGKIGLSAFLFRKGLRESPNCSFCGSLD